MQLTTTTYLQRLGAEIANSLVGYKFLKSTLELRAPAPGGHNVIILSGSNKYSPHISLSFYFGKNFAEVKKIEKIFGPHRFYYHIQQYSLGRQPRHAATYQGPDNWRVDITAPPHNLAAEIVAAIHGMANPFFERFNTIQAARDAIALDDPGCLGGPPFWRQLLLLDLAINDLSHFERWSEKLGDFAREQAADEIAQYRAAISHAI